MLNCIEWVESGKCYEVKALKFLRKALLVAYQLAKTVCTVKAELASSGLVTCRAIPTYFSALSDVPGQR